MDKTILNNYPESTTLMPMWAYRGQFISKTSSQIDLISKEECKFGVFCYFSKVWHVSALTGWKWNYPYSSMNVEILANSV